MTKLRAVLISAISILGQVDAFVPSSVLVKSSLTGNGLKLNQAIDTSNLCMSANNIFVSGFFDEPDKRTDEQIFDVLHEQETFERMIAYSSDKSIAKKRLVSRKARYSGLLDILEFEEGDLSPTTLKEKIVGAGAKSWIHFNANPSELSALAQAAVDSGIQRFCMVSSLPADEVKGEFTKAEELLKGSDVTYTLIRTGEIFDAKEGGAVMTGPADLEYPEKYNKIGRDDLLRMVGETFRVKQANNRSFSLMTGDKFAKVYLEGNVAKGRDRAGELRSMLSEGYERALYRAIVNKKTKFSLDTARKEDYGGYRTYMFEKLESKVEKKLAERKAQEEADKEDWEDDDWEDNDDDSVEQITEEEIKNFNIGTTGQKK